jgi:DNA-binding transcriptional ArsR family regulator
LATDEDIHDSLVAIHSRLGLIDGKATLTVRANRGPILAALEDLVNEKPLVGQIYLLLDGKRSQREIKEELANHGVDVSEPTVSRHVERAVEHGIAELREDSAKRGKVYRKDPNMEKILGLSKNVRKWLAGQKEVVPDEPKGSR